MKKAGRDTGGLLGEDIICRLPNDILLVIFDTLSDLKSLLLCRLVSKHFLSLVCQTRRVSLHITSWNPVPVNETSSFDDDTSPHHQLLHQLKQDPSLLIPRAAFLLTHFSRIQSLHVLIHSSGGCSDSFFRWKLEHNSNTFLALFAKTPKTTTSSITTDNEQEEQVVSKLSLEEIARYLDLASYHLVDAEARRSLLVGIHDCSPLNIENFVVTDLEEEGRICLTKEEVVALKKEERRLSMVKFTVWYAPILGLSFSGCFMREVKLVVSTYEYYDDGSDGGDGDDNGGDNDDAEEEEGDGDVEEVMMIPIDTIEGNEMFFAEAVNEIKEGMKEVMMSKDACEGEDMVFAEAVTEILKKPPILAIV
ncbi:hypothetical protein RJ639_043619 [Escallonia herrerae]|uniref:F-box domain-containing protein n=1 Tax=Escallonia herrerae TaxID=1293975 RepID=A0AA88WCK1_9ASTE|nr:hypothetical protein RJ639_043619 [Escallonia herrerae]